MLEWCALRYRDKMSQNDQINSNWSNYFLLDKIDIKHFVFDFKFQALEIMWKIV